MQFVIKVVVLWVCLCIHQIVWFSQGSRLGLAVPDKVTDGLFGNMGRARIGKFTVNGDTAELHVILEDTIGAKELWLLDFQPYRYKQVTPIDLQTGDLWSSRTGQCSNIEEDVQYGDGYLDDDYFQTRNSSGAKKLFSSYLRGIANETSGIRLDDVLYAGDLETFIYCERSDGTDIWDFSINFEEIQYTTILYATNVRPVTDWSPEGTIHIPPVAYVETHIKLVWRMMRVAMVNFVVSSIPFVSERLLEEIGQLFVFFDFAIVEPILQNDGTPDVTRARLLMGFTTQLPTRNHTMVVFKNGTETYEPEVLGNMLEEVVSSPPSRIGDTPQCNFNKPAYCSQRWEFEMTLKMDLSSLVEEVPLDATGVFQFNFDSYKCLQLDNITSCELQSQLPPWDVRIDLTLQTTVDAVDEETDVITLSIVKIVNDNGEDLRGGRTIKHQENMTVEVNFSPAFLRSLYTLELRLFMVCIGDHYMDSTRGCLGASEDKRYTAFVGDDLSFTFDPQDDPAYLASLQTTDAPVTDEFGTGPHDPHHSSVSPTAEVEQTYIVEKIHTKEYSVWTGVVADGAFIRPYDFYLTLAIGNPRFFYNFLVEESDDGSSSEVYMIEHYPPPGSSNRQPTILVSEEAFQQYFASHLDHYRILNTVFVRNEGSLDANLMMIYSAFTSDLASISYVGAQDPATLPCEDFDNDDHYMYDYEPNWVTLPAKACQFLTELTDLRHGILNAYSSTEGSSPSEQPVLFSSQESQALSNQSGSQDVYFSTERDRILNVLHLEPSFLERLEDYGNNSSWDKINLLLYAVLLFQEEEVLLAIEPSGVLSVFRDKVRYSADEVSNFSDMVLESVEQQIGNNHVELMQRLGIVSELVQDIDGSELQTSESSSSDAFDDDYWLTVEVDESFYYFLWNVSTNTTGYYHGNTFTTTSRNPQIVLEPSICLWNHYRAGFTEYCQVDWLEVMTFWVYTSPHITTEEAFPGGWGFWSEWGDCSQTCGGGLLSRERQCVDAEAGCTGRISQGKVCNQHDCSLFDQDGFRLVFKAAQGTGTSIYDLWASSSFTSDDEESKPKIFKSAVVEEWADTISVEEVKVALLVQDHPVLELVFDGQDSNKMDWFSNDRLLSSPYGDIHESRINYFSIEGHSNLGRRFFISSKYNGCGQQDGWMVILDAGDDHFRACKFERQNFYPMFLYSKVNTMANFKTGQIGIAEEFAVYLKYSESVYIPPPPTLPPPILYTTNSISPPFSGSELQLNEYDREKNVHRSQLQNTALSQERNAYTMTTIYTLVSVDDERTKREGHRMRRTLIASTNLPQVRSTRFISEGCPPWSEFNPIDLTCECLQEDWFYSVQSFQCEPRYSKEDDDVAENNVTPVRSLASIGLSPFCSSFVVLSILILLLQMFTSP